MKSLTRGNLNAAWSTVRTLIVAQLLDHARGHHRRRFGGHVVGIGEGVKQQVAGQINHLGNELDHHPAGQVKSR